MLRNYIQRVYKQDFVLNTLLFTLFRGILQFDDTCKTNIIITKIVQIEQCKINILYYLLIFSPICCFNYT